MDGCPEQDGHALDQQPSSRRAGVDPRFLHNQPRPRRRGSPGDQRRGRLGADRRTAVNHVVDSDDTRVGTAPWVQRTSGRLTTAERRALLSPLARTHVQNAVGRLRLAVGLYPGRMAYLPPALLTPPHSALTRAAEECAERVLTRPLLNHSYRTYVYGRALGELEGTDVDTELLFAGALLHDTGLVNPTERPTSPSPRPG